MEILTSSDAKREFGEVLLKAQKEPIGINRNGKPVAVMLSWQDFNELEALKLKALQAAVQEGITDINEGNITEGKKAIKEIRKLLTDD